MGIYLNPGNEQFVVSVNSELYVDKTELIKYTNSRIGKDRALMFQQTKKVWENNGGNYVGSVLQ